jgi:hypothetical protein
MKRKPKQEKVQLCQDTLDTPLSRIRKGRSTVAKKRASSSPDSTNPGERPTPNHLDDLSIEQNVETLLDIASRKKLPQILQRKGRKCVLVEIILHNPDRYARLITHIRSGVSFGVAAEAAGIGERTFFEWGQKGQADFDAGEDTYFSRFFRDVRRAAAAATADCEQHVKEMDPKRWLSHGPGRIFNLGWSEDVSKGTRDPNHPTRQRIGSTRTVDETIVDAPFSVRALPAPSTNPSDPSNPSSSPEKKSLPITKELEYETLKVMENIGLISMSEEFKQAYEMQRSSGSDEQFKRESEMQPLETRLVMPGEILDNPSHDEDSDFDFDDDSESDDQD